MARAGPSAGLMACLLLGAFVLRAVNAATAVVNTPAEFRAALLDPKADNIVIMKNMELASDWGPVTVNHSAIISSPYMVVMDWCDAVCNAGKTRHPHLIVGAGANLAFTSLWFHNFIPTNKSGDYKGYDFVNSPNPAIVSRDGGRANFNLVTWHWLRNNTWVFDQPDTFWHAAAKNKLVSLGTHGPLDLVTPKVYNLKNFAIDPNIIIVDCYMPFDLDGCYWGQPNVFMFYCPYSFRDGLMNPGVSQMLMFHDIGLDRLVYSYRTPVVMNRTVKVNSCPGTRHTINLDNVTYSTLVDGGTLVFDDVTLEGSKPIDTFDWPSNLPLLLSPFKPMHNGRIILRNCTVRVRDLPSLAQSLARLPTGNSVVLEVPDLSPKYRGPPCNASDSKSCVIDSWRLSQQGWLLFQQGGRSSLATVGTTGWEFDNVTVEAYTPEHCYQGAVLLGALSSDAREVTKVSDAQALLDALGNPKVRYVEVVNDLRFNEAMAKNKLSVNRIVEVRACRDDGFYTVDWGQADRMIDVPGYLIFEGDMVFKGLGWGKLAEDLNRPVAALFPTGPGIVEFEDLTMRGAMPASLMGGDGGMSALSHMLRISSMDNNQPGNLSNSDPVSGVQFRNYYVDSTNATGDLLGTTSYVDTSIVWEQERGGGGGGVPVAAIVAPVVVGVALLALLAALLLWRRRRHAHRSDGSVTSGDKGGSLLPTSDPKLHGAECSSRSTSYPTDLYGSTPHASTTSPHTSRSKSTPGQDIEEACRSLLVARAGTDSEPVTLMSVLGEGSYGKVYKGCWRGTTVAVKIMVLPSYMAGKDRRQRMAIMETAISSSLSHPNIVQTYTYAVEPVKGNSSMGSGRNSGQGQGDSLSLHDSTRSFPVTSDGKTPTGSESQASSYTWEVRLVQEYCDKGSLKDALVSGELPRSASGCTDMITTVETALDVARAMVHLHAQNIVHSDLKARNVLLKGTSSDPRGFTAKVADFGLSLHLDVNDTHISNAYQGTMTHMAPETLLHGRVSRASDVYGFGILLWELLVGRSAYNGIPRALLGHQIASNGLRPEFPGDTMFEYQLLACRCWETDGTIRPTFEQILEELKRIRRKLGPTDAMPVEEPADSAAQGAGVMTPADLMPAPWELHRARQLPSIQDMDESTLQGGSNTILSTVQTTSVCHSTLPSADMSVTEPASTASDVHRH